MPSTHGELFWQGPLAQKLTRLSHCIPVNCAGQAQTYELSAFRQLPPLRHGEEKQFLKRKVYLSKRYRTSCNPIRTIQKIALLEI